MDLLDSGQEADQQSHVLNALLYIPVRFLLTSKLFLSRPREMVGHGVECWHLGGLLAGMRISRAALYGPNWRSS